MSMFFTTINFHDHVYIWNFHFGILVHSGSIWSLSVRQLAEYHPTAGLSVGFYASKNVYRLISALLKSLVIIKVYKYVKD